MAQENAEPSQTNETPSIDARVIHTFELDDSPLKARDCVLLALLSVNHSEPIKTQPQTHALVYTAQVGGLRNFDRDNTIEYDAIGNYFEFEYHSVAPRSQGVEDSLDKLVDLDLIDEIKHPHNNRNHTPREYKITEKGREMLNETFNTVLSVQDVRTLKLVKTLYQNTTNPRFFDLAKQDLEFRELNE